MGWQNFGMIVIGFIAGFAAAVCLYFFVFNKEVSKDVKNA